MPIAFADCEIDEQLYQLRRGGRVVKIEPKVFDVLLFLVEHRDRVVPKHELLDTLWPGEAVSESVLPRCIAAGRRAVGDDRSRQAVIQTVHGRGYRFVALLREAMPARAVEAPVESEPSGAPFVGRDEALADLRRALDAAEGGTGKLALVVGEPGIGKTRLVDEALALAAERGAEVLVGRCYEGEGAPAYWPWVQVLRAALDGRDPTELRADLGPGAADIAQLVPDLHGFWPELAEPSTSVGEQARFRLFDSVARFLERRASRRPVVVALDDLHWADADSLLLFQFMAPAIRRCRVMLVGAYRDVEVRRDHPLGSLLGALAREPHCQRIVLRGLAPAAVASLVESLSGNPAETTVADSIHDLTEGNPFFVSEMVHWLVDEGRLAQAEGESLGLSLPQSVRDAIGRRLDTLSPECNAMLRAAAVIGRSFAAPLLEHVTGTSGDATLELLGEALAAHVIVESDEGLARYAFSHALIRHTLYDELRVPQRVALHRSIGEAIEASGGGDLATLAHHFFEAAPGGDVDRAVTACVRAAERASGLFAYDEAARHYERALEALELQHPPDEARRCGLKLSLGEELWTAGERERARRCFFEVAEPARRLGDTAMLARTAVDLRGFGEMGVAPDETTLALMREALDRVGSDSDLWRSRILSRMAGCAPYANSMQTRRELSDEAYALAKRCGDVTALADALAARYWATHGPDRVDQRFALADELLEVSNAFGEQRLRILALETRIGGNLIRGDASSLRHEVAAYSALAQELRMPLVLFLADLIEGSLALNLGHFDEAQARFESSAGKGRGAVVYADVMRQGMQFWLRNMRGEAEEFGHVESTLSVLGQEESNGLHTLLAVGAAMGLRNEGDMAASRLRFDAIARAGISTLERDEHWLLLMSTMSDLAMHHGDEPRAAELYGLLDPYADLMCSHDLIRAIAGSVRSCLGQLALARGDLALAEAHLQAALERERAEGFRPAACNTLGYLAALHARRDRPGDRARAEAYVAEADAEAVAMGSERRFGAMLQLGKV